MLEQHQELQKLYPNESIKKIIDKGLINNLWIIGDHTIAKISDNVQRTTFEAEDLKLLSNYVLVPKVFDVQSNRIFMSYHQHQRVNWKLLTKTLEKLHKNTNKMFGYHRQSYYGKTILDNTWNYDWW